MLVQPNTQAVAHRLADLELDRMTGFLLDQR